MAFNYFRNLTMDWTVTLSHTLISLSVLQNKEVLSARPFPVWFFFFIILSYNPGSSAAFLLDPWAPPVPLLIHSPLSRACRGHWSTCSSSPVSLGVTHPRYTRQTGMQQNYNMVLICSECVSLLYKPHAPSKLSHIFSVDPSLRHI